MRVLEESCVRRLEQLTEAKTYYFESTQNERNQSLHSQ